MTQSDIKTQYEIEQRMVALQRRLEFADRNAGTDAYTRLDLRARIKELQWVLTPSTRKGTS